MVLETVLTQVRNVGRTQTTRNDQGTYAVWDLRGCPAGSQTAHRDTGIGHVELAHNQHVRSSTRLASGLRLPILVWPLQMPRVLMQTCSVKHHCNAGFF